MIQSAGDSVGVGERLRYQELFDFAPEGYVVTDAAGIIEQVNHAAAALLKTRRDFLVGKPFVLFVAEPERTRVYTHLGRLWRTPPPPAAQWDVWLRPQRASPVAVNLNVAVVAGAPPALRWRLRDITSHLQSERALDAERSLADGLVEAAQTAILVLDDEGRILRSNPFVRRALGYDEEELRGREWASLLPAEGQGSAAALLTTCEGLQVGGEFTAETLAKGGGARVMAWSAKSLARQADNPAAFVVVGHDITELHEAQAQALQSARLAAIGEVTTSLTHESRNALQRARACLDRLRWRVPDSAETNDLIDRAARALEEMTALFEDVRGYAAPLRLDVVNCHLGEVWREAWSQALAVAPEPPPAFAEDAGDDPWVSADRARLLQVFRNLFENAAQACGGGGRVEAVCRAGNLSGRRAALVSVRDTGPGLGGAASRLFEPFFTTKLRGTGLGLAIARRIVEAHGGRITAADRDGGGAEFTVLLPREQP
jgi:PAS domain S-box-containing protein